MLDKFQRAFDNLKKIADGRSKRIEVLENELGEYVKRYPATVGVKNGKP